MTDKSGALMSANHTPGPWYLETAMIEGIPQIRIFGDARYEDSALVVLHVYRSADARLIAAAPDLLAALKLARATLNAKGGCTAAERDTAVIAACDAIAKAVQS
jgi:hypothetical protein